MIQRIRDLIPKEAWGLRVVAILLSVLLWALAPRSPVADRTPVAGLWTDLPVLSVVDPVQSTTLPVQVAALGLPAGSSIEIAPPQPSNVMVRGRSGALQHVAEVVAMLHLSDEEGVQTGEVPVQALDANGMVVTDVTVSPNRVIVSITVTHTDGLKEPTGTESALHATEGEA